MIEKPYTEITRISLMEIVYYQSLAGLKPTMWPRLSPHLWLGCISVLTFKC